MKSKIFLSAILAVGLLTTVTPLSQADNGAKAVATALAKDLTKIFQKGLAKDGQPIDVKKTEANLLKASKKYQRVKTTPGYKDFYQVSDGKQMGYCVYGDTVPLMRKIVGLSEDNSLTKAQREVKANALTKTLIFSYSVGDCKKNCDSKHKRSPRRFVCSPR